MTLAYETTRAVTASASVVLARNPGMMTLDGTNTWILRAPGNDRAIVVDPGPDHDVHLDAVVAAAGDVAAILLTHHHHDHSAGAMRLAHRTRAPIRVLDPGDHFGTEGLRDGEVVTAAGVDVRVWRTPGHTADSLSFLIDDEAVLTGDTILGRGTTVVAYPDGNLGDYLASLRRCANSATSPSCPATDLSSPPPARQPPPTSITVKSGWTRCDGRWPSSIPNSSPRGPASGRRTGLPRRRSRALARGPAVGAGPARLSRRLNPVRQPG